MGIFSRLNTVIKSNLNSLLDEAEDPAKLIDQTVIDMKSELKQAKRELVTALGSAKRLEKEAAEVDAEVDDWERKAVLAIRSGDDSLAREALKFKAKAKEKADRLRGQAAEQASAAQRMKQTIEDAEGKVDDLEARKSTLAAQVKTARATPGSGYGSSTFDELERMAGSIDQLDAEVEVHSIVDDSADRAAVEAKFRALENSTANSALDDELAALKASLDD